MRQLIIGDRIISDDSNAYVIAEIGHNHQGSLKTAKELFQAAAGCGVDAGKLQKRDNRTLYTDVDGEVSKDGDDDNRTMYADQDDWVTI